MLYDLLFYILNLIIAINISADVASLKTVTVTYILILCTLTNCVEGTLCALLNRRSCSTVGTKVNHLNK